MRKIICIFFTLHLLSCSYSQEPVDSNRLELAKGLMEQADIIFDANQDSAIILLLQAKLLFEKEESWGDYIEAINYLAAVYHYRNELDKFRDYSKLAIQEARQKLSSGHPQFAKALHNLNTYYYELGDFNKSIELLRRALEIKKKNKATPLDLAYSYNSLGASLAEKGDYKEALEFLNKGLEIREKELEKTPSLLIKKLLTTSRMNIAWVYLESEQLEIGINQYETIINYINEVKGDNSKVFTNDLIIAYQNLARLFCLQKKYIAANNLLYKALLCQPVDKSFKKPYSLELLGDINFAQGKYDEAMDLYKQAITITEQYYATSNLPDYSRKLNRIATVYKAKKQLSKAIEFDQMSLRVLAPDYNFDQINKNPPPDMLYSKPDAIQAVNGIGNSYWERYLLSNDKTDLSNAYNSFVYGTKIINEIRKGIITKDDKNTLAERTIITYEGAIQTALELYKRSSDEKMLEHSFAMAESNKSLLLLESFNEQTALALESLPDSLIQNDKNLKLEIAFYEKQLMDAGEKEVDKFKNKLFHIKSDLQNLTDHFEKNYPHFHQLKYQNEVANLSAIQNHLAKENQALIEYFVGEEKTYAFVVWANGCKVFEIEKATEVFGAVEQLKTGIEQLPENEFVQQNYNDFTNSAHFLYQQILAPALEQLPSEIKALKIIPDYHFNYVPFDLLLMNKAPAEPYFSLQNLDYVLEEYQVSYDYSATWMLKSKENKRNDYESDFIAYAPSFKKATDIATSRSCTAGDLYDLNCSEKEVQNIQSIFGGDLRLNQLATKQSFESEAGRYKILHMATHSCVDEANPLFNKIFLTDDYLSNADMYNTSLNADLVVLSACNTGSGKLVKGEGVLSLARGFVQAGCASSIVSRWSVDDCATSDIMQSMYKELKAGKRKDEALRLAKLDYLSKADGFTSHPYYWSAFVGYGDMGELEKTKYFSQWWILWGVILMFGIWLWKR